MEEDVIQIPSGLIHHISVEQAWYYRIIPAAISEEAIHLYCEGVKDRSALVVELEILLGKKVRLKEITAINLTRLLNQYYRREQQNEQILNQQLYAYSDDFLNQLIEEAKRLKSSDIHVECYEERCRIRIRIDGLLTERYLLSKQEYPATINRIKILANLDIAEKRLPQDGRISFKSGKLQFDIRVSVLPALYGEKVVLRLLNNDATNIELNNLGFSSIDLGHYLEGVRRPNGIILISGPTGSGKTTTLYATLKLLNKNTRNILTVEDPIEYTLDGVNQVQLKENIGLTFAAALKTFLRQDPDVIMVGEIRDTETANMAIRAALTGHLVLSTIHTNSAWGTVSRLIDMGIPPFLVANTLNTSVAQRLVRLLCLDCKKEAGIPADFYPQRFKPPFHVAVQFLPLGCESCYYTGYSGRMAVYEVISLDHELSEAVKTGTSPAEALFKEKGIRRIAENAFHLFANGQTSFEEISPLLYY